jgi:hypothetical protein
MWAFFLKKKISEIIFFCTNEDLYFYLYINTKVSFFLISTETYMGYIYAYILICGSNILVIYKYRSRYLLIHITIIVEPISMRTNILM